MSDNFFRQLWERRSLILLFALNDIKLRYRSSILGFLWSFLEPLLMLTVLYVIFTNIIKNGIENYPLYLLLGLIIWYMFQRGTSFGLSSLLERAGILQKVYFRREIVVISSCLTAFIMMLFELVAFLIFMVAFHFVPSVTIVFLPLLLVDLFILSIGVSLLLSVFNVYFRDIRFIWQVLLQVGIFVNPIIYRLDMFPSNIRGILELNPLVSILNAAHDVVLYGTLPSFKSSLYIMATTAVFFIIGYLVFRSKGKEIVEKL